MANKELDPVFKEFFIAGRIWFWYMPLNVFQQFSNPATGAKLFVMRALYYFVLFSMLVLLSLDVMFLVVALSSNGDFIQCLTVTVWLVCAINAYQTTLFTWNRGPQLVDLLTVLHENFPSTDQEKDKIHVQEISKDFVLKSAYLVTLYFIAFTGMCIAPILLLVIEYWSYQVIDLQLPLILWFPFDPLKMPWYPLIYLLELWFFSLNTFIILGNASLLGAITMIIGIQFRILSYNLRNLKFNGEFANDFHLMRDAIRQHNRVLYAAQRTTEMFSFQLLVAFTIASIVICIFSFLIIIETKLVLSVLYFLVLVCYLAYTAVFALFGNEFIEHVSTINIL